MGFLEETVDKTLSRVPVFLFHLCVMQQVRCQVYVWTCFGTMAYKALLEGGDYDCNNSESISDCFFVMLSVFRWPGDASSGGMKKIADRNFDGALLLTPASDLFGRIDTV